MPKTKIKASTIQAKLLSGTPLSKAEEEHWDKIKLMSALERLLEIADITKHPIHIALVENGVDKFEEEFMFLTAEHINALECTDKASGDRVPLSMGDKLRLRAFLAFCHHQSHLKVGGVNILNCAAVDYKTCRAAVCDQSKPLVPWVSMSTKDEGLSNWNKSLKPNAKDFKPFREATGWVEHKESFQIALDSQSLDHLIKQGHKVSNLELDLAQRKFLHKVMKDNFLHHHARVVVKKHLQTNDTRAVWNELCTCCDNSVTTSMLLSN